MLIIFEVGDGYVGGYCNVLLLLKFEIFHIKNVLESMLCVSCN